MYLPLNNTDASRNFKSKLDVGLASGCNDITGGTGPGQVQVEEIFPDLHAIFPPIFTLEFQ